MPGLVTRVKLACAAIALAGSAITALTAPHCIRRSCVAEVTGKQVKQCQKSDKYIVFTKLQDGTPRVFENTDSMLEAKWNSSGIQGKLEIGKTYSIKTYGLRVPLLSCYENIVGVYEVSAENSAR